jgi:hypothetical protein
MNALNNAFKNLMPEFLGFLEISQNVIVAIKKRQHSYEEDSQVIYKLKALENYS